MLRTTSRACSTGREAFQMLSRSSEKRLSAALIRVRVPFRPSWLANIESVVKASPQRSGGPWRRVPRAAITQTTTTSSSTGTRRYQAASCGPTALGRVERSIALNTRYSTQVAKAQASM
ncbi:hypothetical protein FQZ97_892350 [compost metagenome]